MLFPVVVWMTVTAVSTEPLYKKIGEKAVLTPDSVKNPITNIVWKLGPNLAMMWNGDDILSYQQFKDRGTLNISTGVMTITGLYRNHSGNYTAEINFNGINKIELHVISPVPKPNLYALCDPEMTYCVLTCDGSTTDTEPVTYRWTAGGKKTSTKELKITKDEKERWFRCTLENPVSSSSSEEVPNPLMKTDWRIVFIITAVILVGCIIFCFRHKCKKALHLENCGGCLDFRKAPLSYSSSFNSVSTNDIKPQHQEDAHDNASPTMSGGGYDPNS